MKTYTRRAVAGGLAAISPGTDILIQGYLGTRMVRALCELYEVPVREIELNKLLDLSQKQVRTALPLLLAVAGNAAKAFPGVGTLAGGLMHAVAYGLIFDALGHAVIRTLETRGELRPAPTSLTFRDNLVIDVETRTRKLLRLALDVRREEGEPGRHDGSSSVRNKPSRRDARDRKERTIMACSGEYPGTGKISGFHGFP